MAIWGNGWPWRTSKVAIDYRDIQHRHVRRGTVRSVARFPPRTLRASVPARGHAQSLEPVYDEL
jgi:hypothetical protein